MVATAFTACPRSYSKVCDTFRPRIRQRAAIRADLGGQTFVHFLKPCAMLNSLVRQLIAKGRPTGVENGLGQVGFGKCSGVDVADHDVIEFPDKARRKLVVEIGTPIRDLGMNRRNTPFFTSSLRLSERLFHVTVAMLSCDLFTSRQRGKIFQAEVDADTAYRLAHIGRNVNVDDDVQKPITATVLAEIGAVPDFSFWQSATFEDTKRVAAKSESFAFALQIASFKRNPSQRFFGTAVTQVRAPMLGTRLDVLFADRIDRTRMQAKFLAAALRKLVEVESAMPAATKSNRVFLPIVAVIPDKVNRLGLPVEQSGQRLNTVAVDKNHAFLTIGAKFGFLLSDRKATASSKSALFLPALQESILRNGA